MRFSQGAPHGSFLTELFETAHAAAVSDGAIRSQLEIFDRELRSQAVPSFTEIPPDAAEIKRRAQQVQVQSSCRFTRRGPWAVSRISPSQDLIDKEAAKVAHNKEAASVTTTMLVADAPVISGGYSGNASAHASSSRTFQMFSPETVRACCWALAVCLCIAVAACARVRVRCLGDPCVRDGHSSCELCVSVSAPVWY